MTYVFNNLNGDEKSSYWVHQSGTWQQASSIYTNGTWTPLTITTGGGGSMAWDTVHFLLLHLGFTAVEHPDYVTYHYRGDTRFTASYYSKTMVPQWSDAQVREILSFAAKIIDNYESTMRRTASQTVSPAPPEKPLSELEVEEW